MADATRSSRVRQSSSGRARLVRQITSCWQTQALRVAVQCGLIDFLAQGAAAPSTLAKALQINEFACERLLRALCALGVCNVRRSGDYGLTASGRTLSRHPDDGGPSLRPLALSWGGPLWDMWAGLDYSVRTGRSVREQLTGLRHYEHLGEDEGTAALFHQTMAAMTAMIAPEVSALPTWRGARRLVDVGGGNGELSARVALAHPRLAVCVFDQANALESARTWLEHPQLASRAEFVAGDFFRQIPSGADRYLLKSILHNWDDAACQRILKQLALAVPARGRLLLIERVRPDQLRPVQHDEALARTDLNMLAGLGGRERSLGELDLLLASAGFQILRVWPTGFEFSVVEAARG